MKTDPRSPALSARSRTFASIPQAAAALGIHPDGLRLAKGEGCPAFRANGNVHEGELVEWLLTRCRGFWRELLGDLWTGLGADLWEMPPDAVEWMDEPPRGLGFLAASEPVFQWLRLVHGDEIMAEVKAGAEAALRELAATIPPCLLDGTATFPPLSTAPEADPLGDLFRPASFPRTVPTWRMDLSPFAVVQAERVEFWQWSEREVREMAASSNPPPMPPRFLILSDQEANASRFPIRHHEPTPCDYLDRWAENLGEPRSLLDFLPPPAAERPPPLGERGRAGTRQRKRPSTR